MTIHLTPDSINYSESQRAHNIAACDKLLALLYKHHGDGRHVAAAAAAVVKTQPMVETESKPAVEQLVPEPDHEPVITYGPGHYIYVQRVVARHFGVSRLDLIGQSRRKKYAIPRHVAMYLIHDGKRTLPEIGRRFGGRDHTTVLHAVRKIADERTKDAQLNHELHVLEQTLKG